VGVRGKKIKIGKSSQCCEGGGKTKKLGQKKLNKGDAYTIPWVVPMERRRKCVGSGFRVWLRFWG